jgi:hypothetical protein
MGYKAVCLDCRVAFNFGMDFNNLISRKKCPQCSNEMKQLSYTFKPPKKDDIKHWETVKYLVDNGFYFDHIYDYENKKMAKYPENIKDAKIFVEKYDEQKMEIFKIFELVNKNQNLMDIDNEIEVISKIMYRIQPWQIVNEMLYRRSAEKHTHPFSA